MDRGRSNAQNSGENSTYRHMQQCMNTLRYAVVHGHTNSNLEKKLHTRQNAGYMHRYKHTQTLIKAMHHNCDQPLIWKMNLHVVDHRHIVHVYVHTSSMLSNGHQRYKYTYGANVSPSGMLGELNLTYILVKASADKKNQGLALRKAKIHYSLSRFRSGQPMVSHKVNACNM